MKDWTHDAMIVPSAQPDEQGMTMRITPESAGWEYVGFEVRKLQPGQTTQAIEQDRETCLVILSGKGHITAGDQTWSDLGQRMDVFEMMRPWSAYVPPRMEWTCEATTELELAICTAPAEGRLPARLIDPDTMAIEHRGHTNIQRTVHDILPDTAEAENLLVVEVYCEDGSWSGYPPHKHDVDDMPRESLLEETYYHKVEPRDGFGLQRVYSADGSVDRSLTVKHDQGILVPFGYHPLVAPPRQKVYFINVMAGPTRAWQFTEDATCRRLMDQ